jgi:amino acid adenylation domain-containing protein
MVAVLLERAERHPERQAFVFLADGEVERERLTYGELDRRARALGDLLLRRGARTERVLLLYPAGLDFIVAFLGCLYAGAIAVPCYPPRFSRDNPRLRAIAEDCDPGFVLTTASLLGRAAEIAVAIPTLARATWLASDRVAEEGAADWREPELTRESLAFLQYTSGSTSSPKGVRVSHGNLLHNEEMIRRAFEQTEESVVLGWLPLYHDMGLIGNVLQPLYSGGTCVLFSPLAFLQQPRRWLAAISRYRATTSGGPDFAYDLCVRKIAPEQRAGLDLRSWRVAFSGAEPVRAETLERFSRAFGACGFVPEAFYPCYGLAEATLFASGGIRGAVPTVRHLRRAALEQGRAEEAAADEPATQVAVGCGHPWLGQEIVVVDPAARKPSPEGRVGEIWVAGPSVAQGYWNRSAETEEVFGGVLAETPETPGSEKRTYLRTGDLGFFRGGEVFITGRAKDLIIIRGRNLYPQDLERTTEASHPLLRSGSAAAFSFESEGRERLVIIAEVEGRAEVEAESLAAVVERVRQAIAEQYEVRVYDVVLLRAGSVPKTSSGKIQRRACRQAYLDGGLTMLAHSVLVETTDRAPQTGRGLRREALLALAPAARPAALLAYLRERVASRAGLVASELRTDCPLTALGLDSLVAAELQNDFEGDLGVEVTAVDLLDEQSLDRLAALLAERLEAEPRRIVPAGGSAGELVASHGQQALWFLDQLDPGNAAYHIAVAARSPERLDAVAFERALEALVARHSALRTTFSAPAGLPLQHVHERLDPDFGVVDAAALDAEALAERLGAEAFRPFDLAAGPLLRVWLFQRPGGEEGSVLLWVIHHAVADFWSLSLLAGELGALYAEARGGTAARLPDLPRTYTDYVHWQEARLAGESGERLGEFWRQRLSPEPPPLHLPTDRPRPLRATHAGASRAATWTAEVRQAVEALGRHDGATLYATLLAGFQALLCRYTGQEDLVVGSPTAGRGSRSWEDVVGYFVNPVAVRVDLAGDPTFTELLSRVRSSVLAALAHQDYPFVLAVERLRGRDPGLAPVFQTMLVLQQGRHPGEEALAALALGDFPARVDLGGMTLEALPLAHRPVQFELSLAVARWGEGLGMSLHFNRDLFDGTTADRLLGHLGVLLAAAASHPETRLADLPLLTLAEEAQVREWTDGATGAPGGILLHQLFEAQARRTPGALALVAETSAGRGELTYAELDARANRLAWHLRGLGAGAEERIGVCLARSPEMLVALLAVLKAGAAYLPLDPAYPAERLAFMLADAGARWVLVDGPGRAALPAEGVLALDVTAVETALASGRAEPPPADTESESLAYVIYTSGSTGRPKGVALPHRGAVNLVRWALGAFPAETLSGVLATTSICFDLSVFEIFTPLAAGGTVLLADSALAIRRDSFGGRARLLNTVPSLLAELLAGGAGGGLPPSVSAVNLAGEPLPRDLARRLGEPSGAIRITNLYGPSETTTYSTASRVSAMGEPNIGRPIAATRVYLRDAGPRPVGIGIPAELAIGGAGVARGYLGRPDLTAERFVPDPWSGEAGLRLYRTGDLARFRADGEIEFLGRLDQQVKVRGFRIEPGEIEERLRQHPRVAAAAVVGRRGPAGDLRLVTYVVPQGDEPPTAEELRLHLRAGLPEAMVPAFFVFLQALPLSPSGKVDRRALPAPEEPAADREGALPRTPVEELLVGLWCELLGLRAVGIHDSFFDLGGHSLLWTRLLSRIRQAFGVELPVAVVFAAPTVAALAERIASASGRKRVEPPLSPAPRIPPPPLSYAQERLWLLAQLYPGNRAYNLPGLVHLTGPLCLPALAAGLSRVVDRHEALRTTFPLVGGQPVQAISPVPPEGVPLPLADLSGLPAAAGRSEAERLSGEAACRPFDLTRGPLLRILLLRMAGEEHRLSMTLHHAVADGWSLDIFARELSALYGAALADGPEALAPLPIQYADFAVWQREWLRGQVLTHQLGWWRGRLAGDLAPLSLPADRPRGALRGWRGGVLAAFLPRELAEALLGLARRSDATLYMTLLAVLGTLLHRYTQEQRPRVGSPVANRGRSETEGLIGFFANTLVLPIDLAASSATGFSALLARVREMALGAYAHQDLPFELLVEELQPGRDLRHTPLFDVAFAFEAAASTLALPGLTTRLVEVDNGSAKFDLTWSARPEAAGLTLRLGYATDLFDAPTAARMLGHLVALLAGSVADPSRPVADLPLLAAAERQALLEETAMPEPLAAATTLHDAFSRQAARTPDAIAVSEGAEAISYRELDRRANRLAWRLVALGVRPESPVGLSMERSSGLLVALLGTLKAGGAYVPLDPSYPAERLAFLLADSGVRILITEERLADRLPASAGLQLTLEAGLSEGETEGAPWSGAEGENAAYCIYTSGSTGAPKGVVVTHANAARLFAATAPWFGMDGADVWTFFHSYAFDFSVWEIWGALLHGGRLVVVPYWVSRSPEAFRDLLVDEQVTVLNQTPSAFRQLIAAAGPEACSLRLVMFGGEALDPSSLRPWFARRGDRRPRLYNLYGITETTVHVTCRAITLVDSGRLGSPVGEPLADLRVRLLDPRGHLVPLGVPGEIHVGGPGLARGYLGRPELTAERFVPDPWSERPGDRLYRSGDLARRLPGGGLDYLGRIDQQVKVRGFRIELGEVQAALEEHPAVRSAAVLARREGEGEARLVAWVATGGLEAPPAGELRAFLARKLPEPMLPSAFVFLAALPLTTNGKLDRGALPAPPVSRPRLATELVAPRTLQEEILTAIWAELLGLSEVGVRDSFFDLGGHSLLAARLLARVRDAFGVELPLRQLFETPTVEELAALFADAARTTAAVPPVRPVPRGMDLPLSTAQERLWFLDRFEPGGAALNLATAARFTGPLAVPALAAAWTALADRHEPLRTTFVEEAGRPLQRIAPGLALDLPFVDLVGLPKAKRARELDRQSREEAETGFDLSRGPLVRVRLLRLEGEVHVLLLTVHHIISDGWSMEVLVRDLSALYAAQLTGCAPGLPSLAVQYADFAVWERSALASIQERQVAYWRQQLAGAPPALELPIDRPRPAVQTYRGGREERTLPVDLSARLRALGRRLGATPFMTLLAAFEVLLSRLAGQEDLVVGSPVAGRPRPELEDLIGLFLNSLALRADLSGDPTFGALVAQVRETTLAASAHQDLPFESLLEAIRPERSLARTPLFQVFFNLLNFPFHPPRLPRLAVEVLAASELPAKFDLTLYLVEREGSIRLNLVYNSHLFDRARMHEMLGQYQGLLEQVAETAAEPIGALSLLTPTAASLLPRPDGPLDASFPGAVLERFASWARQAPDRMAVVDSEIAWSYSELARRVRLLAGHLASFGLGRGDVVALFGHRNAPLVLGVLGVLQSGAAYTILDPTYPPARLAEILRLSGARGCLPIAAAGPLPKLLTAALAENGVRVFPPLDHGAWEPFAGGIAHPGFAASPDDLACIAFTSGSTGAPKGVACRQGPLSHFIAWQEREFGFGPADRFSMLSGLAHDPLQRDMFTPLQVGAAIVIPDAARMGDPGWLAAWMEREELTVTHLTPALGQLMGETAGAAIVLPALRYAFLVGDVLTRRDVARLQALAPAMTCVNYYGSTETQRAVSFHVVPPLSARQGLTEPEVLPLGRGIADVQLLILNRSRKLAGIGELGDICMRSPHLAAGYLGDPELTRERFLINPETGAAGDRLYRTGDLGRYLPNGEAVFVARADQQVKVRGFRVELGEIEATLGHHPEVREAVVVLREDRPGDRRLTAYVVASGGALSIAGLREFLKGRLPEYMVPADFVRLDALPLTPNRKLDRRALKAPERPAEEAMLAARTPLEELVAGIWSAVLGRPAETHGDDFFALGGHSLLLTQVASRVRAATGVDLPLRTLFEEPTIAGLARRLEAARRDVPGLAPPPIRRVPRSGGLPLSFAQQRLWFLHHLAPESPFYNLPGGVRFHGALDLSALAGSFAEAVRRHEPLRSIFAETEREPLQVILPPSAPDLPLVDLAGLPRDRREMEITRLLAEEARRPFDLARGPLLRLALLRAGSREHLLLYTLHHIVSDGWSLGLLVEEVAACYAALSVGRRPALPDLPIQQADFASWQRDWLRGEVLAHYLSYWRENLNGAPALLRLRVGRPRPRAQSFRGGSHRWALPEMPMTELRAFSERSGATLFMTLCAAFGVVLGWASGEEDLVVGTDVANRNRVETEGLLGFFVNQLPLRIQLAGDPTFVEILRRVRETALGAYDHQDLPFDQLVDALRTERNASASPIFQVKLNLRSERRPVVEFPGCTTWPLEIVQGTAQLDLIVNLVDTGQGLKGISEYSTDLLDAATVARLPAQLEGVLRAVIAQPETPLHELLAALGAAEERLLATREEELEAAARERFQARRRFSVGAS